MTKPQDPGLLRTALAVTHVVGLEMSLPSAAYRGRTPAHKAEVARLGQAHAAMTAGMDRFAESRSQSYDDKSTEVFMDTMDVLQTMIAVSPVRANQNQEETDERS